MQSIAMLSVAFAECHLCRVSFMQSVIYAECYMKASFAKWHYAECCYADCRYAECRGALTLVAITAIRMIHSITKFSLKTVIISG